MSGVSRYFINNEAIFTEDLDLNDFKEKSKNKDHNTSKFVYKLGEEIENGVRYFGQEKQDKTNNITAMCICPKCGESWRVRLTAIRNGSIRSCCSRKTKG